MVGWAFGSSFQFVFFFGGGRGDLELVRDFYRGTVSKIDVSPNSSPFRLEFRSDPPCKWTIHSAIEMVAGTMSFDHCTCATG